MTTARSRLAVAVLGGALYALGAGRAANDEPLFPSVERLMGDEWQQLPQTKEPRSGCCAAVLDGQLYAIGGCVWGSAEGELMSSVERYDPEREEWRLVAPMGTPRCDCACAVLDEFLYVLGGIGNDGLALASVERFDARRQEWEEVTPMTDHRVACGAATLGGKLYAVGGRTSTPSELSGSTGVPFSTVERFDPATGGWEEVAPMNQARSAHGVAALDGKLFAAGGRGGTAQSATYLNSIESFDPRCGAWSEQPPLPVAREGLCLVSV